MEVRFKGPHGAPPTLALFLLNHCLFFLPPSFSFFFLYFYSSPLVYRLGRLFTATAIFFVSFVSAAVAFF